MSGSARLVCSMEAPQDLLCSVSHGINCCWMVGVRLCVLPREVLRSGCSHTAQPRQIVCSQVPGSKVQCSPALSQPPCNSETSDIRIWTLHQGDSLKKYFALAAVAETLLTAASRLTERKIDHKRCPQIMIKICFF